MCVCVPGPVRKGQIPLHRPPMTWKFFSWHIAPGIVLGYPSPVEISGQFGTQQNTQRIEDT